jgi:hypothetical protein
MQFAKSGGSTPAQASNALEPTTKFWVHILLDVFEIFV